MRRLSSGGCSASRRPHVRDPRRKAVVFRKNVDQLGAPADRKRRDLWPEGIRPVAQVDVVPRSSQHPHGAAVTAAGCRYRLLPQGPPTARPPPWRPSPAASRLPRGYAPRRRERTSRQAPEPASAAALLIDQLAGRAASSSARRRNRVPPAPGVHGSADLPAKIAPLDTACSTAAAGELIDDFRVTRGAGRPTRSGHVAHGS